MNPKKISFDVARRYAKFLQAGIPAGAALAMAERESQLMADFGEVFVKNLTSEKSSKIRRYVR